SGPRIRCPLCGWSPRKHDRWSASAVIRGTRSIPEASAQRAFASGLTRSAFLAVAGRRTHGVKVGGCQGEFKVADKIEILFRHKHTKARVARIIACERSSEKRIGAEFLEPEKEVSGLESSEQTAEAEEKGL